MPILAVPLLSDQRLIHVMSTADADFTLFLPNLKS